MSADLDLSPREVPPARPGRTRRRRWLPIAVLVVVIAGGGILLTKFLTSAVDYYCNVDEIGVKDGCDVGRSIRVQGEVVEGSVQDNGDGSTDFQLAFNGVTIPVDYHGVPGGIFQECINVVVTGRMLETGVFDGTVMAVKHSNEYESDHSDRVSQGEDPACSQRA